MKTEKEWALEALKRCCARMVREDRIKLVGEPLNMDNRWIQAYEESGEEKFMYSPYEPED